LILLDTHVVVWLAFEETRLSKAARAVIVEARLHGEGLAVPI
jgi:PIN domain nuclease of toxin-antitoxin system